jgi:tetratricopeptide (TPR) repeat protein
VSDKVKMRLSGKNTLYSLIAIQIVFIILFFDPKLHLGGDDADYIRSSMDFLNGMSFPSWHGSFYPIAIAPFVFLFGANIVLLKCLSILMSVGSLIILRNTFYKKIPDAALLFALAIYATCYSMLIYSSTTYSEPLFILLQSTTLYLFFKLEEQPLSKKKGWLIAFGISLFLLSITRNIGIVSIIVITIYYLAYKRWKPLMFAVVIFSALHISFNFLKRIFWNLSSVGIEGQLSRIRYRNFYNVEDGIEDNLGLIKRLWENSIIYLSNHFPKFMGLKSYESLTYNPYSTVFIILLFVFITILAFRKNRYVFFCGLYCGVMLAITFITQQQHWNQERLILVYFPLLLIMLGYYICDLREWLYPQLRFIPKALLVGLPIICAIRTLSMDVMVRTTFANLSDDRFLGYPEQFKSYAQVSEWAGQYVPTAHTILCRKQGISSVYGKREFLGIVTYKHSNSDSADALLMNRNISYILADNFADMNTVRRVVEQYLNKYPLGLKMVIAMGHDSPAALLEVCREEPLSDQDYYSRIQAGLFYFAERPYYYTHVGTLHFNRRNYAGAIPYFSEALKRDARNAETRMYRAISYYYSGERAKSQTDLEQVIKSKPSDRQTWNLIAHLYAQFGEVKKAESAYQQFVSLQ